MEWELINPPKETVKETLLTNRGVKREDIDKYLNLDSRVVRPVSDLYSDENGTNFLFAKALIEYYIQKRKKIYIIQDCDGDGITSSAFLINYLYDSFGESFSNNLTILFHEGKEHGITMDIEENDCLLIVPDAGTNNTEECKRLYERNIPVLILDHHPEEEKAGSNLWSVIINPMLVDYPEALSGVGVVYKFCKFLDNCYNTNYADSYLDLVSVGMISDMMDLSCSETKFLILEGTKRLLNPFLKQHRENPNVKAKTKGVFNIESIGYYYAPYLNAMCRSGTLEEKENFFNGLLKFKAYEEVITDTKEKMTVCEYSERLATRVKNRQDRKKRVLKKELMERVEKEHLDRNSVIFFLNEETEFRNIAGLLCNDLKEEYHRPVCCLENNNGVWTGSARGYIPCGVRSFKKVCESSSVIEFVAGHDNAFGLGIKKEKVDDFIKYCNTAINCSDKKYFVDYELTSEESDSLQKVKDTVDLGSIWGTGMEEPLFYMKVKAPFYNTRIYKTTKKQDDGTVKEVVSVAKISLASGLELVRFYPTDEELDLFPKFGEIAVLDVVGKCQKNIYNGKTTYGMTILEMDRHRVDNEEEIEEKKEEKTQFNFIF